ncbi:MAG: PTS sugar transporter subunit IIA, partial [Nitrospinae bacterium]|nr:PTS sugar transporter subunit IIA [Nitrospinota bacterium]
MKISGFINENLILTGLAVRDKAGLMGAMVDHLIAQGVIEPARRELLVGKLMEREALSSTGIGGG